MAPFIPRPSARHLETYGWLNGGVWRPSPNEVSLPDARPVLVNEDPLHTDVGATKWVAASSLQDTGHEQPVETFSEQALVTRHLLQGRLVAWSNKKGEEAWLSLEDALCAAC